MITCTKCGSKFRFMSRFKTINHHKLECSKCETTYKMKYSSRISCIFVILIFTCSNKLNDILPETTFFMRIIRNLSIVVAVCYVMILLLSYIMGFDEIDESEKIK